MKLSVGLITFNEEENLGRTLEAVKDIADEIVISDSFSTDKTKEIALNYGVKFFPEEWKGYGGQKNSVIEKCQGEWVLLIDADEVVTNDLKEKIKKIIYSKNTDYEVYEVNRCSVIFGKKIKHGGWSNDYVVRLFRKNTGEFDNVPIHETFMTDKPKGKITETLLHYTYNTVEDYFDKFNRYTSEGALRRHKKGKRATVFDILSRPLFKFIKMYIVKLGFLDGVEGFVLSVFSMFYVFVIYVKLLKINMEK